MNILKNKSVIRLYAFLTACIIIITLLLSGLNVCAEGNIDLITQYDLPTVVFDYSNVDGFTSDTHISNNQSYYDYLYENNLLTVSSSEYISSDYPHYCFFENTDNAKSRFIPCPEGSFILINTTGFALWVPDSAYSSFPYAEFYGSTYSTPGFQTWSTVSQWQTQTVDGTTYRLLRILFAQYDYKSLLVSDLPIYNATTLNSYSSADIEDNINNNTPSGADSTNYMYFKDFNISYSVSGLYSGNIVCYGDLNEYQKEHLDEFVLTYSFNFDYSFYVPTVGGWTSTFTKNYSYQQTLSDFFENGSSKVFTLKDIMQNINTQDVDSEYGNLYQLITHYANQGTDLNSVEVHWTKAKMKTTVFIVSANNSPSEILNSSDLHSNSFSKGYNFLDGKSSTYSDGITSNNNPYQTSESGSIENENQLNNMDTGVTSSNIPSSSGDNGGSGTSVVTGDNNIVINNNPTFNNDGSVSGSSGGSSGGVASTFYDTFNPFKTLFSSLNGDNSLISDETADSIGANRFITVMSSTFSFIPEGMWTALTTFLIASLSILIVAVVIRVLLDLL